MIPYHHPMIPYHHPMIPYQYHMIPVTTTTIHTMPHLVCPACFSLLIQYRLPGSIIEGLFACISARGPVDEPTAALSSQSQLSDGIDQSLCLACSVYSLGLLGAKWPDLPDYIRKRYTLITSPRNHSVSPLRMSIPDSSHLLGRKYASRIRP